MKRLIILALAALPFIGFAQKVTFDEYNKEGDRILITDKKVCRSFTDKKVLSVGLGVVRTPEARCLFFLDVKVTWLAQIYINKGDELTLWLNGGDVIKLQANDDDYDGMVRDIHTIPGTGYISHDYSARASFSITREQIQSIIDKGVRKIQCDTSPVVYINEFEKDKIGKVVDHCYEALKQKMLK